MMQIEAFHIHSLSLCYGKTLIYKACQGKKSIYHDSLYCKSLIHHF